MYKVKGHEHLRRDGSNSAVISSDQMAHQVFMSQYNEKRNNELRVKNLEVQVADMSTKLDKILELLGSK
jgi:hypothetical protein